MADYKQLDELRAAVRQKAAIENDGKNITDDEVDNYINDAIKTFWTLAIDGTDGTLFSKSAGKLTKLGPNTYALPGDFFKLIDVSIKAAAGRFIRSQQADPQEHAQLLDSNFQNNIHSKHSLFWNVEQGRAEIAVFPNPTKENLFVRYVPIAPVLSLDTDTLKFPSDWYMWVVYDAAIQCALKRENDPSGLMSERDKRERRFRDDIRAMTPTRVKTIRRVAGHHTGRFALPDIR